MSAVAAGPARRPDGAARDLRLDFFRGLGLLFIYVDHIPENWVSYLTLANIVFCDAAEIFVFISGMSAALVFGRLMAREGYLFAAVQVLRRTWTLYVAHVFLFVIFTAQVSYTATRWRNPMFMEEMNVAGFLDEPGVAIIKALSLQFQPMFMGILPLYIVLLAGFALLLPVIRSFADLCLAAGLAVWGLVQFTDLNLASYPQGTWFHNPFAWQLLFLIGAALGFSRHVHGRPARLLRAPPVAVSAAFLACAVMAKLLFTFGNAFATVPQVIADSVWRLGDKSDLGPLRLMSFLALAHVASVVVRPDSAWLGRAWATPIVRCGQHSLGVFCFGIFLSVAGHALLVEYGRGNLAEAVVSFAGAGILLGGAWFLAWSKRRERGGRTATAKPGSSAGGEE